VVNIARWDSVEDWQAAVSKYFSAPTERSGALEGGAGPVPQPALYTVVRSTPDPRAED
jgi:hypothetical protein